jgi:hypothetical protein
VALAIHPHLAPGLKKELSCTSPHRLSLHGLFEGEYYLFVLKNSVLLHMHYKFMVLILFMVLA